MKKRVEAEKNIQKELEDELRGSETRYRALTSSVNDSIISMDPNGNISFWNEAAEKTFGYKKVETLGKNLHSLIVPSHYIDAFKKGFGSFKNSGAGAVIGRTVEMTALRKDGLEFPIELSISSVIIGGSWHATAIIRDITERKRTEEELKNSEERLKILFEYAPVAYYLWDLRATCVDGNKAAEEMTGYKKEALIGKDLTKLLRFSPNDIFRASRLLANSALGQATGPDEFSLLRKDGSTVTVEIQAIPVKIKGESLVLGIARDITERKQSEETIKEYSKNLEYKVEEKSKELHLALRETELERDKIDTILKSIADGLIVIDKHFKIILLNQPAEVLMRVRFSDVIHQPVDSVIQDKDLLDRIKAAFNKKKSGDRFDFEFPEKDPKLPRVMRARTSAINNKEGEFSGIAIIVTDVTYEHEVDRMKNEFITTAAHELRTPLTSIRGFSEILLSKGEIKEEEKEKFLSYINQQSVNLTAILNDLFVIARIESGKSLVLNRVLCDISKIVGDTISNFQNQFPNYMFNTKMPSDPIKLMLDKTRVKDVLERILSNAVKFSSRGSSILIRSEIVNGDFLLSIEDQGIGMSPHLLEKVFEKYYKADTTDSSLEGAGLGLTVVKHIMESHGGKVRVESELGKGTTVRLTFPLQNKDQPLNKEKMLRKK